MFVLFVSFERWDTVDFSSVGYSPNGCYDKARPGQATASHLKVYLSPIEVKEAQVCGPSVAAFQGSLKVSEVEVKPWNSNQLSMGMLGHTGT